MLRRGEANWGVEGYGFGFCGALDLTGANRLVGGGGGHTSPPFRFHQSEDSRRNTHAQNRNLTLFLCCRGTVKPKKLRSLQNNFRLLWTMLQCEIFQSLHVWLSSGSMRIEWGRDFRLSQRCSCALRSCRIWFRVTAKWVLGVLRQPGSLIFDGWMFIVHLTFDSWKWDHQVFSKRREQMTQWRRAISE